MAVAMQEVNKQLAVSEEWLSKHIPVETNMHATIEEWCFQCGPCKVVIKKRIGAIQSVED
jgi:hypothetical protein